MEKQVKDNFRINHNILAVNIVRLEVSSNPLSKDDKIIDYKLGVRFLTSSDNKFIVEMELHADSESSPTVNYFKVLARFEYIVNIETGSPWSLGEKEFSLPKDFIERILFTSYSTLRGLMITKLAGTPSQGILLPILNTTELMANMENQAVGAKALPNRAARRSNKKRKKKNS